MKTATQSDWKTELLSSKKTIVSLNKSYTLKEMESIQKGLIPREMEDKWFIYWENNTLYFHRSWTGHCMYIVHFTGDKGNFRIISADINRDLEQYKETSNERDMNMILYLIDVLLLHKEAVFPDYNVPADIQTIKKWSQIGRAMLDGNPDDE